MNIDVTKPFEGRIIVTPEQATEWLELNLGNRRLRKHHVSDLVRQIKENEWQNDHVDGIVFSDAGRLIDGQHRLKAIATAGIPVMVRVNCGVRDDLRKYLGGGAPRSLDDRISFDDSHRLNMMISRVLKAVAEITVGKRDRMGVREAEEIFNAHRDAITFVAKWLCSGKRGIARTGVAVALLQMYECNKEKAELFAECLNHVDHDVMQARILRDYLLRVIGKNGSYMQREVYTKSVSAMKAYLEDRKLQQLKSGSW